MKKCVIPHFVDSIRDKIGGGGGEVFESNEEAFQHCETCETVLKSNAIVCFFWGIFKYWNVIGGLLVEKEVVKNFIGTYFRIKFLTLATGAIYSACGYFL